MTSNSTVTSNQSEKILVAYSFMAALNERTIDLFDSVYMPLFKRAMSEYSKNAGAGKRSGERGQVLFLA